jgi:hypothetical protein
MEFASEFLIEAIQHGLKVDQVPIRYRRRFGGQPKLRTFRDGLRHLRLLLVRARDSHSEIRDRSVLVSDSERARVRPVLGAIPTGSAIEASPVGDS